MASMLRSVDESLGRIVAKLEELELAENTIIVFTSDHGGNVRSNTPGHWKVMAQDERRRDDWLHWAGERPPTSNAPLRDGKGVPVRGWRARAADRRLARRVEPGSRSAAVVTTMDLYPTLLDLIGVPPRAGVHFDGVSIAPVLRDSRGEPGTGSPSSTSCRTTTPPCVRASPCGAGTGS